MRRLTHAQVIETIDAAAERAAARLAFDEKRERRIERLRARADRRRREGDARIARSEQMASVIPLGQPILVGHYSEKRDRRYREKIHQGFSRGVAALKEAEALERRAESAESNRAVSSDDPDACEKLADKLERLKAQRERCKAINKAVRAKDPRAALAALGESERMIDEALTPDFAGRLGVPGYVLQNLGSEIRRLEGRIAVLKRQQAEGPKEEKIGAVRIEEGDNRVRVFFPGKPSEAIRSELKRSGFRWSPTAGAWQRHPGAWAWHEARRIAAKAGEP